MPSTSQASSLVLGCVAQVRSNMDETPGGALQVLSLSSRGALKLFCDCRKRQKMKNVSTAPRYKLLV